MGLLFDVEKLSWLNGMWIREELSDQQLADRLQDWALNRQRLLEFLPFAKQRMETFSDLAPLGHYLLAGMLPITRDQLLATATDEEQLGEILQYALWRLEALDDWRREEIFSALQQVAAAMDIKLKPFLAPLFIAIAGSSSSISVMDSNELARCRHVQGEITPCY